MTLRLIGLMSVVLLLSLASFGLLMSYHQDQLMQEVTRTVSEVGRATLRGMELHRQLPLDSPPHLQESGEVVVWATGSFDADLARCRRTIEERISEGPDGVKKVMITHYSASDATDDGKDVVERRENEHANEERQVVVDVDAGEGAPHPAELAPLLEQFGDCLELSQGTTAVDTFVVNVEAVRAESDPASGIVLTIPKFTPPAEGAIVKQDFVFRTDMLTDDVNRIHRAADTIRLPIEQRGYEQLYQRLRSNSLFLFLGVFVVGVVASAGLATRFTRPIRKLDGAIRQLSAGDLDVSVRAGSKDEIGRLSRAFNEMAGRLRSNRERTQEMSRREKLSALGRLAAGVAHDVRNPLHSIGLTLQHLADVARPERSEPGEEFDRSVEIIRGEIRRLDQLVGNFLRFARSERRERERINLGELFRETARLVQKESERRGVELELEVDEAVPPVLADGEGLRSSILNLVLNSFEAMPKGGRLKLALRLEGGNALIEVADTGEGIPEEDLGHVFDFAYTTREGGNGLGLAMVHQVVVEEHRGHVSLDSRPGEGTRIRIELPVQPEEPEGRP